MSAPNVAPGGVPHYVLATGTDATAVLRRLVRSGWQGREGFEVVEPLPVAGGDRQVRFGRVDDIGTVPGVIRAARHGAAIVAIADGEVARTLVSGLARLGPVRTTVAEAADPTTAPLLPDQRALLQRLANGETIASAAAAEFLSLRTANRRIAQARQALGVTSTREAVRVFVRQRSG